ncbi:hypothetical protein JCM21900_003073 [Sporobolomyces salmonicolor]
MSAEMKPLPLTLVVAATPSNAIGRASSLPWRLPKEMAYFARMTKGEDSQQDGRNAVIMGRKSWDGIPAKFRPLVDRVNVVVSRQEGYDLGIAPHTHLVDSLPSAAQLLRSLPTRANGSSPAGNDNAPLPLNRAFLIGGAQLYSLGLSAATSLSTPSSPYIVDRILLTRLFTEYPDCDTFLHDFASDTDPEGRRIWRQASHQDLRDWAGWDVPEGRQTERDRLPKEDKMVEYEFQMWVR